VIHDVRATLGSLPPSLRNRAPVVLMAPAAADASTVRNARSLSDYHPADRIVEVPRVSEEIQSGAGSPSVALNRKLDQILRLLES